MSYSYFRICLLKICLLFPSIGFAVGTCPPPPPPPSQLPPDSSPALDSLNKMVTDTLSEEIPILQRTHSYELSDTTPPSLQEQIKEVIVNMHYNIEQNADNNALWTATSRRFPNSRYGITFEKQSWVMHDLFKGDADIYANDVIEAMWAKAQTSTNSVEDVTKPVIITQKNVGGRAAHAYLNAIKLIINSFSFNRIFDWSAYIFWCRKKT